MLLFKELDLTKQEFYLLLIIAELYFRIDHVNLQEYVTAIQKHITSFEIGFLCKL